MTDKNCPWCHRVTLARSLLGLEASITMDVAFPNRTEDGFWEFAPERIATLTGQALAECTHETGTGQGFGLVRDIYAQEGSDEKSVPVLYDKQTGRIVSNESAEIVRMLSAQAVGLGATRPMDLYPAALKGEIDALNTHIYTAINNGAYKAGFSSDQAVYAAAYRTYFEALETLEDVLSDGRAFLTGAQFTQADLRLFPTLYRHDPVYYTRMKLNGARVLDYPHLWRWLCRVYAMPGAAQSNSLIHCRQGYFGRSWNNVIPLGPTKPMAYPEAYRHPDLAG